MPARARCPEEDVVSGAGGAREMARVYHFLFCSHDSCKPVLPFENLRKDMALIVRGQSPEPSETPGHSLLLAFAKYQLHLKVCCVFVRCLRSAPARARALLSLTELSFDSAPSKARLSSPTAPEAQSTWNSGNASGKHCSGTMKYDASYQRREEGGVHSLVGGLGGRGCANTCASP